MLLTPKQTIIAEYWSNAATNTRWGEQVAETQVLSPPSCDVVARTGSGQNLATMAMKRSLVLNQNEEEVCGAKLCQLVEICSEAFCN